MADCQFRPEAVAIWADRKNVRFLSDAQREDAYLRAVPFLLEQMKALIEKGWTQKSDKPDNDGILFDLTHYDEDELSLPSTFNAFFDAAKEDTWRTIFTNSWVFLAAWDENDLFIDSSPPLRNIFYLLQVLAPGMLVIRRDAIDDECPRAVSRALPPKSWIEENYYSLEEVMESTEAMADLLSKAEDQNTIAYDYELVPRTLVTYRDAIDDVPQRAVSRTPSDKYVSVRDYFWDREGSDDDSYVNMWGQREIYDFTACSQECGYCGRCDY